MRIFYFTVNFLINVNKALSLSIGVDNKSWDAFFVILRKKMFVYRNSMTCSPLPLIWHRAPPYHARKWNIHEAIFPWIDILRVVTRMFFFPYPVYKVGTPALPKMTALQPLWIKEGVKTKEFKRKKVRKARKRYSKYCARKLRYFSHLHCPELWFIKRNFTSFPKTWIKKWNFIFKNKIWKIRMGPNWNHRK